MSHANLVEPNATLSVRLPQNLTPPSLNDIEEAITALAQGHGRPDLVNDLVDYASSGRLNATLVKNLDRDEVCRNLVDLVFRAQLETIRDMARSPQPS